MVVNLLLMHTTPSFLSFSSFSRSLPLKKTDWGNNLLEFFSILLGYKLLIPLPKHLCCTNFPQTNSTLPSFLHLIPTSNCLFLLLLLLINVNSHAIVLIKLIQFKNLNILGKSDSLIRDKNKLLHSNISFNHSISL